jgi:hypothetical protein
MNVEIGAEAAQFPEKEYIYTELPLQCDVMYARKSALPLCLYSVGGTACQERLDEPSFTVQIMPAWATLL